MNLPAIKGKISQLLLCSRRILLPALFSLGAFLIIIIFLEVGYYFYFGYHLKNPPIKGAKFKGWYKGESTEIVEGTVIKKADDSNLLTIEKNGERAELEIPPKVFLCDIEDYSNYNCIAVKNSEIKEGQFLTATKLKEGEEMTKSLHVGGDWFVRIRRQ